MTFDAVAFDPAGVARMLRLYGRLLELIATGPVQTNQAMLLQAESDLLPAFG